MTLERTASALILLAAAASAIDSCRGDRRPPAHAPARESLALAPAHVDLTPRQTESDTPPGLDTTRIIGVKPPSAVEASLVSDESLVNLMASVEVLRAGEFGQPAVSVRVVSTWGPYANLDCDCLATDLFISLNAGIDEQRLYRLEPLLDPTLDSLRTENGKPVAYVTYGLAISRRSIRVEATMDTIVIAPVTRRSAVQPN